MNPIDAYIAHGWSIVPLTNGKSPGFRGWEQKGAILKSSAVLQPSWGVGLMHAYSGTMAFDIDDWGETKKYGIDVDALYRAPDAVTIISGKQGKGKLLYRMPFGMIFPTKQYKVKVEGRSHTVFELRCGTEEGKTVQDALPPTIHPDTGQPYKWGGKGDWANLPVIPAQLLQVWRSLMVEHTPTQVDTVDASWDEIKQAMLFINPDCSRDEWIDVGMALRWAGDRTFQPDQAFHLWDTWSKQAPHRYPSGPNEMAKQWASFRSNKKTLVTLNTLFFLARENGWVRPTPDVSEMFQGVVPAQPADIQAVFKPKPPLINLDLWPKVLAKRAREVSDGVGCDPSVPLWAGLAAVCGAVDAQSRLELNPTFKVPPVLWLMTLGDPAAKKSPGSWPMIEPLQAIEASQRPAYKQALTEFEAREIMYAKDYKVWEAYLQSEDGLTNPEGAPIVREKPDPPVAVRIVVQDITSQALVMSAADRPRGLLCHLDEMNGWVAKLTSRNSGEDRSAWVMAYESKRYELERVGSGRRTVENLAVSIYGNVQPRVLEENFDALATDGLLQRFLPVVLRNDQDRRGKPLPDFLTSANQWEMTLHTIFAVQPTNYRLSAEATKAYEAFQDWYQDQKQNERLLRASDTFLTAFGKLEGLTGRLILLFHVIEDPYTALVSANVVERVIKIVRQFVIPTYRYLLDDDGSMSSFDSWLVDHIIHYADEKTLTLSEIRRSAARPLERARVTQPMMQNQWVLNGMYMLEQQHWVRRVDDGSQEHRGRAEWVINPHLVTMFADYRRAVVKAKADRLAEISAGTPDSPEQLLRRTHAQDLLE